jgi:hypothetical protein
LSALSSSLFLVHVVGNVFVVVCWKGILEGLGSFGMDNGYDDDDDDDDDDDETMKR